MSVLSKEELLSKIKSRIGEDTSDDALSFIEDCSDTLDSFDKASSDSTDWKAKYEENDAAWRKRYKDRFFSSGSEEPHEEIEQSKPPEIPHNPEKYDDLFTEKEK